MKMKPKLVSIIIPSRSDRFLQKTVSELLNKARGDIEIIVVLDGYWPKVMVEDDQRVTVIHHGGQHKNYGMRASINTGVSVSKGEFIMKTDEHCAFDEGFDVKLVADCEDNWLVTPRRFRLDDENWAASIGRENPPIDNMFLTCPIKGDLGLNGKEWRQWRRQRKHILIDDCLTMQGSCYFMTRKHWDWLGGLDDERYGAFHFEPQEIVFKTWLGGGRVVVNKKTWYAHRHRGPGEGRKYGFCNKQTSEMEGSRQAINKSGAEYWVNNCWAERKHDFEWLINKFWPIPEWPDNWKELIKEK